MDSTNTDRQEIAKWLRLHLTDQVGPTTFARMLEHFGGIDQALAATPGQLTTIRGIGRTTAERIVAARSQVDIDAELDLADKLGVRIITLDSADYPPLLRQIHAPPPVLYVKGELVRNDQLAVAIVGSRSCTQYGREQASRLSHLLAAAGFTIVSGLARGIDTAAHRGAIAADGRTIAVQGCGLAKVFPPENAELAEQIAETGALVSELPLGFEPLATTFPTRNRIIAGLSLASIIIEARPRSGAMITARLAMEENRQVMALPGRVDSPGSFGPHQLIKDGAALVENIQDIMDALGDIGNIVRDHATSTADQVDQQTAEPSSDVAPVLNLTDAETTVLEQFDHEPVHVDEIIHRTDLPAAQVYTALTHLQLKGILNQLPGSYYQKPRR